MTRDSPLNTQKTNKRFRVRGIALPIEHGGWGFLFEPLVAAIAVAPSIGGVWISLLFIGAFLTRQPLKVWLSALLAKRELPQTRTAFYFVVAYSVVFVAGLVGSLNYFRVENNVLFMLFVPVGLFQVYCDVSGQSRRLIPELIGVVVLSSSSAAITYAGGWTAAESIALWAVFVARLAPSVIYVRNRLRLEKGKRFSYARVAAANFAALLGVGILYSVRLVPLLTVFVFAVLTGRAMMGMSRYRVKSKAIRIGIWEVIYGILTVLSVIAGYYFDV